MIHGDHCIDEYAGRIACGWPELHNATVTPSHPITVEPRSYRDEANEWDVPAPRKLTLLLLGALDQASLTRVRNTIWDARASRTEPGLDWVGSK